MLLEQGSTGTNDIMEEKKDKRSYYKNRCKRKNVKEKTLIYNILYFTSPLTSLSFNILI